MTTRSPQRRSRGVSREPKRRDVEIHRWRRWIGRLVREAREPGVATVMAADAAAGTAADADARVSADAVAVGLPGGLADEGSFAALYDRYARHLYRYAYQRAGGQFAEDLVADTFLAAFQQRGSYDPDRADVRPWLFGILTRKIARHHRSEQARYRAVARSVPEAELVESPADRVAARITAGAARVPLARALGRLSSGDRDVLLLVAWCDLSYDEVSVALDIPLGTVRSRLHRARRKVREALGGTDPTIDSGAGA